MTQDNEFSCFNQDQILNTACQVEQKRDREQMEETTLQRISREAAAEIWKLNAYWDCEQNLIASIIYTHFRNGKEL